MKRSNCTVGTAVSKKTKVCTDLDAGDVDAVAEALRAADQLPSNVAELLCATLSDVLIPYSDERHEYQQKMAELVAVQLRKIEASMEASIAEAKEAMGKAEEDKVARANDLSIFESTLASAKEEYAARKTALADITDAFNVAKDASDDSKKEEERARAEIDGAGLKKEIVQNLLNGLDDLHQEPAKIDSAIKQIVKNVDIESAMLIAVPNALSKDAASRQGFDHMVMTQLREKMTGRIAQLAHIVEESGARMSSLNEACSAATTALDAARQRLLDAGKDFTTAQAAQGDAEASMKNAQKISRSAASKFSASKRTLDASHAQLDLFRDGAMTSFEKLKSRVKPAVVPFDDDEKVSIADSPMPKVTSVEGTQAEKLEDTAMPAASPESLAMAGA